MIVEALHPEIFFYPWRFESFSVLTCLSPSLRGNGIYSAQRDDKELWTESGGSGSVFVLI